MPRNAEGDLFREFFGEGEEIPDVLLRHVELVRVLLAGDGRPVNGLLAQFRRQVRERTGIDLDAHGTGEPVAPADEERPPVEPGLGEVFFFDFDGQLKRLPRFDRSRFGGDGEEGEIVVFAHGEIGLFVGRERERCGRDLFAVQTDEGFGGAQGEGPLRQIGAVGFRERAPADLVLGRETHDRFARARAGRVRFQPVVPRGGIDEFRVGDDAVGVLPPAQGGFPVTLCGSPGAEGVVEGAFGLDEHAVGRTVGVDDIQHIVQSGQLEVVPVRVDGEGVDAVLEADAGVVEVAERPRPELAVAVLEGGAVEVELVPRLADQIFEDEDGAADTAPGGDAAERPFDAVAEEPGVDPAALQLDPVVVGDGQIVAVDLGVPVEAPRGGGVLEALDDVVVTVPVAADEVVVPQGHGGGGLGGDGFGARGVDVEPAVGVAPGVVDVALFDQDPGTGVDPDARVGVEELFPVVEPAVSLFVHNARYFECSYHSKASP